MPSSTRSSSTLTPDVLDDDEEEFGGEYEVVTFEHQRKAVVPVSSAPTYPAPQPPNHQNNHSNLTQDELDDLHDYEKVRLGHTYAPEHLEREHAGEFDFLPCLLQHDASPDKMTGSSPGRLPSSGGKSATVTKSFSSRPSVAAYNPPSDRNGGRMAMLSFPTKRRSPGPSTSVSQGPGSDMTVEQARQRLLDSALQSVVSELERESQRPSSVPRSVSQTFPIASVAQNNLNPPSSNDKPYFDHLFPAQASSPPVSSPMDTVDTSTYSHLAPSSKGTESGIPISTPNENIRAEYALAMSPETNSKEVDSVYDVIREPEAIVPRERSSSKLPVSGRWPVCEWTQLWVVIKQMDVADLVWF